MSLQFLAVEQVEHLVQHPLRRIDPVGRVGGLNRTPISCGQRATQPVQEVAVGHVLVPGVVQLLVLGVIGKVEQKPLRLQPPADRLPELLPADLNLPHLHHLVGAEPVQVREGDLPDQLVQGCPWACSPGP